MAYSYTSNPDGSKIIRAKGRFFVNPTDLTQESGWGTALGYTKNGAKVVWNQRTKQYSGVINGEDPIFTIYCGGKAKMTFTLRSYENPVLEFSMPGRYNTESIKLPGNIKSGNLLTAYRVKLLFVPDDKDYKPSILMKNCEFWIKKTTDLSSQNEVSFFGEANGYRGSGSIDDILFVGLLKNASL